MNNENGSRSDETCQTDMYNLKSFHTPHIVDRLMIVSEELT